MSSWQRYRCPSCDKDAVVLVVFGFPGDELIDASGRGEVLLGGCTLPMMGTPQRPVGCTACGWSGGLEQYGEVVDEQSAVLSDRIERAADTAWTGQVVPGPDFLADVIADAVALEGPDGRMGSRAVWQRAESLYFYGSRRDAIEAIRAAMVVETRQDHVDGESMVDLRGRLAFCLSDDGQHDESLATWEALLPVLDRQFGPDHTEALGWKMGYGECLSAAGRHEVALEVLRDVVDRLSRHLGADAEATKDAAAHLASAERAARDADAGG